VRRLAAVAAVAADRGRGSSAPVADASPRSAALVDMRERFEEQRA
jgi:hypothetical protein